MPRVKFSKDFAYNPHPAQTVMYRAGGLYLCSREQALAAVQSGCGVIVQSPGETVAWAPAPAVAEVEPPRISRKKAAEE